MRCRRSRLIASALTALLAGPLSAQAPAPLAFVGVRIVDGSGNEPFSGTVVIEGGRIRAAGRTVETPAGATIVDGAGKTLLPGLVDVRALDDETRSAGDWSRLLSRLLAAGITTAVVPRVPANAAVDASLSPRLIVAGDQIGAVMADAADGEARAADARSRGQRVRVLVTAGADLSRVLAWQPSLVVGPVDSATASAFTPGGPVTMAPDASSAPPPAGALKALEAARVRLAWGSAGTAARLDAPHASLAALVSGGLAPLAVVTAATSGGAWGLGLQSDRGFIAAGMRADLLLVEGDPTTAIADLARIERIYVGGVAVDREALARAAAEPVAPPPDPTPAPAAPAVPAATDARAASPAPAPPTRPESARARRQRLARERAAAAAAAKAPATPPAVAPDPAPAPGGATAVPPGVVPADPSPASPATSSVGAPAVPAATPAPSSPAPAPAAAPAGVPLGDALLDDFEQGENRSAIGPAWVAATEEGISPTTIVMGRVVKGLRDHALLVSARMGRGPETFARAALPLSADGRPVDVSRFRGLRFDARGEGRYRIIFVTRSVADGRYHQSYFSGSPLWTPVSVPFASTGQNGAGARVAWTGRDLVEIRFELVRDAGRLGWLELDNVRFY